MKQKIIAQGAEAKIILSDNLIIKDRIQKDYRITELDKKIRKSRTKAEIKLLNKASKIINAPMPIKQDKNNFRIEMPYIIGEKLSKYLDKFPLKKQEKICTQIGKEVAKLHNANIIHGDLTTSNMILKNNRIFFIDFGLGYISHKIEDKAVDIHLFKQALEARHFKNWKILFGKFKKAYKESKDFKRIAERLKIVEKRGRYKH